MTTYLSIMVICNYKLILNNLQSFKNKQKSFIVSKGDRADIKNTQVSPKKEKNFLLNSSFISCRFQNSIK